MNKIAFILLLSFLACSSLQAKKLFVEMEFHKNSIKLDDGSNKCPFLKMVDSVWYVY
jgi:hypothetical protein